MISFWLGDAYFHNIPLITHNPLIYIFPSLYFGEFGSGFVKYYFGSVTTDLLVYHHSRLNLFREKQPEFQVEP